KHGTSDAIVSHNISEMAKAGHPVSQAVAAALRMKDESKKFKYAEGGDVVPADNSVPGQVPGVAAAPVQAAPPAATTMNPLILQYLQSHGLAGPKTIAPPAPILTPTPPVATPQAYAQGGTVQHFDNGGGAVTPPEMIPDVANVYQPAINQDVVNANSIPGQTASESARTFEANPPAEALPNPEAEYQNLFGKQISQDAVNAQS